MKKIVLRNIVAFTAFISISGIATSQTNFGVRQQQIAYHPIIESQRDDDLNPLRVLELGVRYMPTVYSLDVKRYNGDVISSKAKLSNGFGAMLAINFSRHVGIQGEIDYFQISQSYTDRSINRDLKVRYFNVPVLLSLNTNKKSWINLNVVVGPQFGFSAGSKVTTSGTPASSDSLNAVVALKKNDVGLAYGAGLEIALNESHTLRLDFGYRGFYGLVKIDASHSGNTYNIIANSSRKSNGAYIGLALLF